MPPHPENKSNVVDLPDMDSRPSLIYTVAFGPPGSEGCRTLAKMLASSLLRTFVTGDVLVFRNSEAPLFLVERKGLEEVYIDTPDIHGLEGAEYSWCWKYKVREQVIRWMELNGGVDAWNKVVFLDADSLALRNIDHLLDGDWDIGYQVERGLNINSGQFNAFLSDEECEKWNRDGVNSGTVAVDARRYAEVMEHWEKIDQAPTLRPRNCSDQGSWNRLLIETDLRTHAFDEGEVQFPMYTQTRFGAYKNAALVHNLGGDTVDKIRFTFGLYMNTFFCDPSALFFNFLEM